MIQSLLRSMELLEVLKEKNRNFSIAELAEAMDLPPSTVHRILQTFCEKKYVCLLYTSPSPRDQRGSRMPSSA